MDNSSAVRRALFLVASMAIGAMSGAAFAQSSEYRRGYDQGYRDGVEAQSNQEQSSGSRGRIVIDDANYGTRRDACDAREAIERAAGWRRHVTITADNSLCGDPAPDRPKRLEVRYHCGRDAPQRAEAREGSVLSLSCR
ncbi:MAG: hypothetical protein V4805_12340 [Pseudomonadota bacterium]